MPKMQSGGSIVNAGSALSLQGREGAAVYAVSKHAVVGLTRSVVKAVGPQGTRVNCIAPYVNHSSYFLFFLFDLEALQAFPNCP